MPLSDAEIDKLEELLFAEELEDEALDYFGLHGLVCASCVGPRAIPLETLQTIIFSGALPSTQAPKLKHLQYCIDVISQDLNEALTEGTEPNLPYESEEEVDACLESWCIGFIEGFFQNEAQWFEKDEEVTAELLLPIMALSGLFETEEFEAIQANDKLMSQFETIIPDQLTDIFLYFHAK